MSLFIEISLILGFIALLLIILERFRLPPLLGYITTGMLIGPNAFKLIQSTEMLNALSEFGVIILLFIIGIHLSPSVLKDLGIRVIIVGCLQVVLSTLIGSAVFFLLDFSVLQAILLGLTFALSSTILVLKLLGDAKQLESLHARIAIGILIIQDIIVSLALIFLGSSTNHPLLIADNSFFLQLGIIVTLISSLVLIQFYLLPKLLPIIARNQESLFVFSLAWGFAIASVFLLAGLSPEIGALFAGVLLSTSDFAEEISSRLKPLRDFFVLIFFVTLGATITFSTVADLIIPCLLLVFFVVVIKPLVIIFLMQKFGYHRKVNIKTALSLGQLSEFSFILVAIWFKTGWLSDSAVTITTIVGITAILISSLVIPQLESIEQRIIPFLPKLKKTGNQTSKKPPQYSALLIGYNRVGEQLLKSLKQREFKTLVVDFDPKQVEILEAKKIIHLYGDASDLEFLQSLPADALKVIISTLPTLEINLVVCKYFQSLPKPATLLFFASSKQDAYQLYQAGAAYVIVPHHQAADALGNLVERFGHDRRKFAKLAIHHL